MRDPVVEAGLTSAGSEDVRFRTLPRPLALAAGGIAVALALGHIWWNTIGIVSDLWKAAIHFAGFGLLAAIHLPPFKRWRSAAAAPGDHPSLWRRWGLIVDIALGIGAAVAAVYIATAETGIYARGKVFIWSDWVATLFCLAMAIELTRRATGLVIPILVVVSLAYMLFLGSHLGGALHFPGWSIDDTLFRAFFIDEGLFGQIARISATSVFMFMIFGACLVAAGIGDFIISFARALAGRMTGGPGFVAVIASGLMGTISGSAIANTAATGVITIPLMRRAGFPAKFAAAVEAAASTGGQLMPPIMGAGAFVMASFTHISYGHIIAVAALPALLYFLSVGFFVRVTALRYGLLPTPDPSGLSPKRLLLERGPVFFLPIGVLVALLIYGFTPPYAAGVGCAVVIVASWLTPHRMGPVRIMQALILGVQNMIPIAVLLVAVGGIIMVIQSTGVGNTISLMLVQWSGGSMLLALVLVALASLVLGMGLPVVAAYIVLAPLAAPALAELVTRGEMLELIMSGAAPATLQASLMLTAPDLLDLLGRPMSAAQAGQVLAAVPPELYGALVDESLSATKAIAALLTGHMIVFWLSQDSNVTPPVCLAAFTAAAIARTPQMATGVAAWRLAKGLYLVPVLFAYQPFLSGDWGDACLIFGLGLVAIYASVGAMEGFLEYRVNIVERLILAVLAGVLFWPLPVWIHGAAIAAFSLFFAVHLYRGRLAARDAAA
ncbi:MAG: TRAP transporter permease [Alphaproteobacteria bacterium]